jgi:hypothetical protein
MRGLDERLEQLGQQLAKRPVIALVAGASGAPPGKAPGATPWVVRVVTHHRRVPFLGARSYVERDRP